MEVVLLILIVIGFAVNFLLMRFFFKRLSDKLGVSTGDAYHISETIPEPVATAQTAYAPNGFAESLPKPLKNDLPEQDPNEMDFDSLANLPKDIKFEVEGGDSVVPPGFTEAPAPKK